MIHTLVNDLSKKKEYEENIKKQKETTLLFKNIQDEGFELFKKKNTDYGNSFEDFGTIGILIRMNDKVKRLMSIEKNNVSLVNTESLRDTLLDLQNYSTLAILELDNSLKSKEEQNKFYEKKEIK